MTLDPDFISLLNTATPDFTPITAGVLILAIFLILLAILGNAGYMITLLSIASYAYPIARMKAIGTPFIQSSRLQELLDSGSVTECLSRLRAADHPLGSVKQSDHDSLENHLLRGWYEEMSLLASIVPSEVSPFFEAYLEQAEVAEIKRIIRLIHGQKSALLTSDRIVPVGVITADLIESAIRSHGLEDCIRHFHTTRYGPPLETAFFSCHEGGSILPLEEALDQVAYGDLKIAAEMIRSDMASPYREYMGQVIDIQNIRTLIRAKHGGWNDVDILPCLMEGGHTFPLWRVVQLNEMRSVPDLINQISGTVFDAVLSPMLPLYPNPDSLLFFDLALDRYHLSLAERISLIYYHTGGPLIAYLVDKGLEMRNIWVILSGISASVSPDQIQKYLVYEQERV